MKKEIFAEIIKTDSLRLSKSEIEAIMEEELNKDPEKIDAELIDLCLEALEGKSADGKGENHAKHFTAKKFLLIAAILSLILAFALSTSADYLNINVINRNIFFNKGNLGEEYEYNNSQNDFLSDEIPFPHELLTDSYTLYDSETEEKASYDKCSVKVEHTQLGINGEFSCYKNRIETDEGWYKGKYDTSFKKAEEIKVGELDVLLLISYDDETIIEYGFNNWRCELRLFNCTYEEALTIIKSIK